ncbi:MAG: DNA mismatch repair protein MutS [Flavobacteriaceae bacterium]|nr:DNA mismatch repair protein MutS [Flavobacteriaceae bacterium]
MQKPLQFYTAEKDRFEQELTLIKKKLATSSLLRLGVFLATTFSIYFFFRNTNIVLPIIITGIILFLYLVSKHTDMQYKRDLKKKLIEINATEIKVLNRDYFSLDEGNEFIDSTHFYSYDIDLFGRGSFFQYINRTITNEGKNELAKNLIANEISSIKNKQEAIKELAQIPKWRQHFSAIASLVKVQHPAKVIIDWIHNYKAVFPQILSLLPMVFSVVSLLLIVLASTKIISGQFVIVWFFIGLGISGIYLKKVNQLYKDATKAKDTFKQYHKLLNEIETTTFTSQILKEKQQDIQTESQKASLIFAKFSKTLDALDQRNNMIMAVVGNAFLLWDLQQAYKIEQWINKYNNNIENWFKVIAFFDAQNSLANIAFNHPNYVFPEINKEKQVIKAQNLGHPLLKESQRIDNNYTIESQQFFIITGANMAGKSTFLRTVSLAIVMANIGLPVCAESFQYNPIKLITSMRTSDSLADDESYFFSELKRLKFIVEEIKSENYFIILDEILKGTNSTDKAIGSKKFVQKLVASNSTGIIATHDLSLCEIEKELSEIENYYFDAEIINDELHFDYKLKEGVCKNMNASFLLKKMEIV